MEKMDWTKLGLWALAGFGAFALYDRYGKPQTDVVILEGDEDDEDSASFTGTRWQNRGRSRATGWQTRGVFNNASGSGRYWSRNQIIPDHWNASGTNGPRPVGPHWPVASARGNDVRPYKWSPASGNMEGLPGMTGKEDLSPVWPLPMTGRNAPHHNITQRSDVQPYWWHASGDLTPAEARSVSNLSFTQVPFGGKRGRYMGANGYSNLTGTNYQRDGYEGTEWQDVNLNACGACS